MEHRAGVGLDGDPVLRLQFVEVKRRHQRRHRGRRRLVATDLKPTEPTPVLAHVIGVVDHPGAEPQHLFLKLAEDRQRGGNSVRGFAGRSLFV